MPFSSIDTANTLSVAFSPGQDMRFPITSSESIFTFGDYRIERNSEPDALTGTTQNLSFTPFSTLENMGVDNFDPQVSYSVKNNELRPVSSDPFSYSYFSSFYTEVARSINNIINTFPFAVLANNGLTGDTIFDYSEFFNNITGEKTSTFKISGTTLINQGFVFLNSGSTNGNQKSLMTQTNLFEIQLSAATTATTISHAINTYSYIGGTYPVLEFKIKGFLSEGAPIPFVGNTSACPVYIRPSQKRMTEYRLQQTRLERQLLRSGLFDIPDIDDERQNYTYRIPWPRTIDGFNPDISGNGFNDYKDTILLLAGNTDSDKTDIMIKTIIPENYLDFDTDTQIYRKIVSSYAKQFDEIKQFIDNIAYAHTLTYNEEENVPKKFMVKLSNLLGWKLSSSFSQIDLFKYLADDENEQQNSFAYYNVEIWKRILININWLYKKKGTRDALQFLFKLMGAPDCLIVFDELVYDITSTLSSSVDSEKVNSRGFINYNASKYIFQEGGNGRGNGNRYIEQWSPEFNPLPRVDNIKVQVGDTAYTGSENVVNSKEVFAYLSPAAAVECDVFSWYQQSGTCWVWGSSSPYFSANTVPFEYAIDNCDFVNPESITGMSFSQYLEFLYSSNIDPKTRKTNNQSHTTWMYPELKKIYMNYFLMSEPQSNRVTIKKLEAFLGLIEVNFRDYLFQIIPATTILENQGIEYRNTLFQRQKFVYKEGINSGSEFQKAMPPNLAPIIQPIVLSNKVNDFLNSSVEFVIINTGINEGLKNIICPISINCNVNLNNLTSIIPAVDLSQEIQPGVSSTSYSTLK